MKPHIRTQALIGCNPFTHLRSTLEAGLYLAKIRRRIGRAQEQRRGRGAPGAMLQVIPDGCGDTSAGAVLPPRTCDIKLLGRDLAVLGA